MATRLDWQKDRVRHQIAAHTHDALHAVQPQRTTRSAWRAIRGGVMPWGLHKGRRLSAIPLPYLDWMHRVRPPGDALRQAIGRELACRRRAHS